jgi:hypothetical protein
MEWECFGSDSDSGQESEGFVQNDAASVGVALVNTMFIKLMSLSPLGRRHGPEEVEQPVLQPEIGLLGETGDPTIAMLQDRLLKSGFKNLRLLQWAEMDGLRASLDIIMDMDVPSDAAIREPVLRKALLPGGLLITQVTVEQQVQWNGSAPPCHVLSRLSTWLFSCCHFQIFTGRPVAHRSNRACKACR